jgi:hypothetical protein
MLSGCRCPVRDDYLVVPGPYLRHEPGTTGDPQTFALSDRIAGDAQMSAQMSPAFVEDRAGFTRRAPPGHHEGAGVCGAKQISWLSWRSAVGRPSARASVRTSALWSHRRAGRTRDRSQARRGGRGSRTGPSPDHVRDEASGFRPLLHDPCVVPCREESAPWVRARESRCANFSRSLQTMHGFGVSPPAYVRTNGSTTSVWNSRAC